MLRGDRYDEKADVYSFGVILWEIMTGHRPFSGYRLRQVIAAVCDSKERPSDLVSVPVCVFFFFFSLNNNNNNNPFF